jgi:hypothetical protein
MQKQTASSHKNEEYYLQLAQIILLAGLDGVPQLRFRSATELALEYKQNLKYKNDRERVIALINWETSKNFSTGFISGVGGLITLPVAIPAALSASWVIQARLAAAIANVYGHNLSEERIRTLTLLCMLGDAGKDVLKQAGITVGKGLAEQSIAKISNEMLIQINQQVGFKLLARAGEAGVTNLTHFVPIAGGIVGGTIDAVACRAVGHAADHLFGSAATTVDIVDVDIIEELSQTSDLAAATKSSATSQKNRQGKKKKKAAQKDQASKFIAAVGQHVLKNMPHIHVSNRKENGQMKKPPEKIDGANVLLWAWSQDKPFFCMPVTDLSGSIPIFGLAICRYADSGTVYRFSCNASWETENDFDYGTGADAIEAAMTTPSGQYDINRVVWRQFE